MVEKLQRTAKRYKAMTPNHEYKGKVYGVRFEDGAAFFDDLTVKPSIGLTADQIAEKLVTDFGYDVQVVNTAQ